MVNVHVDNAVMRVNQSKIRRDHDEWHDVAVEDLKPKLSCGASFEFQELKT